MIPKGSLQEWIPQKALCPHLLAVLVGLVGSEKNRGITFLSTAHYNGFFLLLFIIFLAVPHDLLVL